MKEDIAIKEIKEILFKHINSTEFKVFIFGSRAEGTSRKFSDWDIGIEGEKKLPLLTKMTIEDELEESNIPYTVDVVDFSLVSKNFKNIAKQKVVYLKP